MAGEHATTCVGHVLGRGEVGPERVRGAGVELVLVPGSCLVGETERVAVQLLAPQLAIVLVFFYWPASQALFQSVFIQDAFGGSLEFVGLENFQTLFADELYLNSFNNTVFADAAEVQRRIRTDISAAVWHGGPMQASVGVKLVLPELFDREPLYEMAGLSLDRLDIECSRYIPCLLYTSPSPRDRTRSRMPSSA